MAKPSRASFVSEKSPASGPWLRGFVWSVLWALVLCLSSSAQPAPQRPIIVGSEEDYPPFATGKTGEPAGGFTVDLWKAVAREAGPGDYTIRVRSFREILEDFRNGKVDVMINLAQSDERRLFADFSVPHVVVQGAIFVRKGDSAIHSEADFAGKSIIVIDGDLAQDYAISKGWAAQLVRVATAADGFKQLAEGKHDAMLVSKLAGMQTLLALKIRNVRPLEAKAGFSQKFSFAVRKGNSELLAKINEGLSITKSSGTYDALYEQWFGVFEPREISLHQLLRYGGPVGAALVVLFGVFLVRQHEREKASQRVRESEERYRRIVETAEEGVLTIDPGGKTTFVNPKMAKMLGYSVEEMMGRRLDEFMEEGAGSSVVKAWEPRRPGSSEPFDIKFRRKDGSVLWAFISTNSICDTRGYCLGALAMITDITKRKQAEELSSAVTRIGTLMHSQLERAMIVQYVVAEGVAALGSETAAIAEREGAAWRVRYIHGMPPETVGLTMDPGLHRHVMLAVERAQVVAVADAFNDERVDRELMRKHKIRSVLVAPIAIRGEPFGVAVFNYHAAPRAFSEAELNFALQLGLSAGIALENARLFEEQDRTQTELRKAKADLTRTNTDLERLVAERTVKLQETVGELEHFSYSITHDLRAPLRAMQGFATILNEESGESLSAEHKDYLQRIAAVAGRMDQLITDALNFSRTVRQALTAEQVDLSKLLRDIIDSYPELQSSMAQIELQGEIPPVLGNVAGLTQCFSNLLGNAVKFVKPGQKPEIRIWAERVRAGDYGVPAESRLLAQANGGGEDSWVRIWVEDKGLGISKDFQPRIFDMFQRESNAYEGTGIGLALVRKVTERMGGRVGVESEPGEGSRFWLVMKAV